MTERERLMKRISSYDFAVIELHIYLDTHPNDKAVADKLADYNAKSNALRKEYEEKFGPIQAKEIMPTVGRGFQIRGHGITTRRVISYVGLREKA